MFFKLEPDDELRKRVLYVGGDGPRTVEEIKEAEGSKLDDWAWRFSLQRRTVKP